MNGFFDGMYRDYQDGLKELMKLRNKYIEQLRMAYRDPEAMRTDDFEKVIAILNEEIAETRECIKEIRERMSARKEDVLSA